MATFRTPVLPPDARDATSGYVSFLCGHLMRRWHRILRPLPLFAALGWLAHPKGPVHDSRPSGAGAALAAALSRRGLETTPADVHFVDPPPGALASRWKRPRAVVRARHPGGSFDVFVVRTELTPEGALLDVDDVYDVTRTAAADEADLVASPSHAAWTIGGDGKTYRVEIAELRGESLPVSERWPAIARLQHAITSLQRTGQASGIGRRSFKLDPPSRRVVLRFEPDALAIEADDHRITVPFDRSRPIGGARFVNEEDRELAQPGNLVTWAVDRARDLSWFGDERMQLTKAIAYRILDAIDRAVGAVHSRPPRQSDLLASALIKAAETDPETGWPPPPIPPLVSPPLPDEGSWLALDQDPFVRTNADAPPPLVTAYFRGDGARPDCSVYVVEWDPRQVDLDMTPGTEEPQSATGETGTGMIPRKPEIMSRLLGAFNGAFQSTHGDYGMMVDGSVLVPPKPYSATIARLEDGTTGFGTWPEDLTVPTTFASFRQNLTPLVADGKYNPYGREWWGGVPHDWEDETHTVRSAVCLTREGFIAYFYATKIDPAHLGRVLTAARCDYGIHLDMNQGHTGLELYRAFPDGTLPSLGKLDGHWQAEGDVIGMPGWKFRGRRLLKNMQLMHFPRYIRRGMRDYFYLMLKPILPGAPLTLPGADAGEGAWRFRDLPQRGFPPSISTTSIRPNPERPETKVRVLRLDPETLEPAPSASSPLIVAIDTSQNAPREETRMWLVNGRVRIGAVASEPGAVPLWAGARQLGAETRAAACVDSDGKIVYAEVATAPSPASDGPLLARALEAARCNESLFMTERPLVAIGGGVDLSEHPVRVSGNAARLSRRAVTGSARLFRETPTLAPAVWMPLQRQTRFWPKETEPAPSASSDTEPIAGPSPRTPER